MDSKLFKFVLLAIVLLLPAQFISMAQATEGAKEATMGNMPTVDNGKVKTPAAGTSGETFSFQADVSKIMDILIHSLYSKREIFLRELISNASDALDKIRFFGLTEPEKYGSYADMKLHIRISCDKEKNTLTISDTGIGMTKEQLISELGTVARSGTSSFIEAFEQNADISLIGQFGVGFYSVYLVADTVTVISRHAGNDKAYVWESAADQTFVIGEFEGTHERGTTIILHLKEDMTEFTDTEKIKEIVTTHSKFVGYPIYLEVEKETEVTEEEKEGEDGEIKEEEEEEKGEEKKPEYRKYKEDEVINDSKPLWTKQQSEITDKEYDEFFEALTNSRDGLAGHTFFTAEGEVEFRSILFLPKKAAPNAYSDYSKKKGVISLYVRRVLITSEFDELLPGYLGFVRGVVDSNSLPLNVNREMLQQSKVLKVIGKKLTRKAIGMVQDLAKKHLKEKDEYEEDDEKEEEEKEEKEDETKEEEDNQDYLDWYKEFGKFIKLGITEDRSNQVRLAKLLRFHSTRDAEKLTSLEAYVERMKEGQKAIYYIAGESVETLMHHPTIEKLTKKGFEVLLLTDSVDESCLQSLGEFQSHKISDTSRATLKFDETDLDKKKIKALENHYKPLTNWLRKVLGSEVTSVVISKRLETSPGAVVTGDYGWTANMERIMQSQVFTNVNHYGHLKPKKTFEVNPNHPVVKTLLEKVKNLGDSATGEGELTGDELQLKDSAVLLYQACLLSSGFPIPSDSALEFRTRLERLIRVGLSVSAEAPIAEPDVEIPETEAEADSKQNNEEDVEELEFNPEHAEL